MNYCRGESAEWQCQLYVYLWWVGWRVLNSVLSNKCKKIGGHWENINVLVPCWYWYRVVCVACYNWLGTSDDYTRQRNTCLSQSTWEWTPPPTGYSLPERDIHFPVTRRKKFNQPIDEPSFIHRNIPWPFHAVDLYILVFVPLAVGVTDPLQYIFTRLWPTNLSIFYSITISHFRVHIIKGKCDIRSVCSDSKGRVATHGQGSACTYRLLDTHQITRFRLHHKSSLVLDKEARIYDAAVVEKTTTNK